MLWNLGPGGLNARKIIQDGLELLDAQSRSGDIVVRYADPLPSLRSDEAGAALSRGRSGVTSNFTRNGTLSYERQQDDTEMVCAVTLFSIPQGGYEGRAVLHVPHGMGYKSVLEPEIVSWFKSYGLVFSMKPCVNTAAYAQAVRDGRIKKLRLSVSSSGRGLMATDYARGVGADKVTIVFEPHRGQFMRVRQLEEFLANQSEDHFRSLLQIEDSIYEEADVEVKLPNGTSRTFRVDAPESGGALMEYLTVNARDSRALGGRVSEDDEPDESALDGLAASELRQRAVSRLVPQMRDIVEAA